MRFSGGRRADATARAEGLGARATQHAAVALGTRGAPRAAVALGVCLAWTLAASAAAQPSPRGRPTGSSRAETSAAAGPAAVESAAAGSAAVGSAAAGSAAARPAGQRGSALAASPTPARPRAAVFVSAGEGVDAFVPLWLGEIGATVLRAAGRRVATAEQAAEALAAAARPPAAPITAADPALVRPALACARDARCAREVAVALGAPSLLFVDVARGAAPGSLRVCVAAVEVERGGRVVAEAEHTGPETEVASRVRDVAGALGARPAPCAVVPDLPDGATARIVAGNALEPAELPPFVASGEHTLEVRAPNRTSWRGVLRCEEGRRLALRAR